MPFAPPVPQVPARLAVLHRSASFDPAKTTLGDYVAGLGPSAALPVAPLFPRFATDPPHTGPSPLPSPLTHATHVVQGPASYPFDRGLLVDASTLGAPERADLVATLTRNPDVGLAHELIGLAPPPELEPPLEWLDASPRGIGARPLWQALGDAAPAGQGGRILLVEMGVSTTHVDIDPTRISVAPGHEARNDAAPPSYRRHGLKSLGVLVAGNDPLTENLADERLTTGVAWATEHVLCFSAMPLPGDTADARVMALEDAIAAGQAGDVLLLELQGLVHPNGHPKLVPLEADPVFWLLLRTATDLGITVVAAAGNGGLDLDGFAATGLMDLTDAGPDSGSMLVASAQHSPEGWRPAPSSNRGSRVGAFAPRWVPTTDVRPDGSSALGNYVGTSAAAAVVAAAAAVVQQAQAQPLAPEALRAHLMATGTQGLDGLGRLPDLGAALAGTRGAGLELRDTTGHSGPCKDWMCPDIVVQPLDCKTAPTRPDPGPSRPVAHGCAYQVRVFTRSGHAVEGASVTVWAVVSGMFAHPSAWRRLGTAAFPPLEPGRDTLSDPIPWKPRGRTRIGRYCLVAQVHHPDHPGAFDPRESWCGAVELTRAMAGDDTVGVRNHHLVETSPRRRVELPLSWFAARRGSSTCVRIHTSLPPTAELAWCYDGKTIPLSFQGGVLRRLPTGPRPRRGSLRVRLNTAETGPGAGEFTIQATQIERGSVIGRCSWVIRTT